MTTARSAGAFERRFLLCIGYGLAAVLLGGCAGQGGAAQVTTGMSEVKKQYADVASLAADAPFVLRGRIERVKARMNDNGGVAGGPGVPMVYYDFRVSSREKVSQGVPSAITVAWLDVVAAGDTETKPLTVGTEYLLFLRRLEAKDAPGADDLTPLYTPVGGDAGGFILSNGQAIPVNGAALRLEPTSPTSAKTLTLEQVLSAVS